MAEDITSRFLNVIGLFNGALPFIAIQMKAFQVGDRMTLVFTRVVDELSRGIDDDDDSAYQPVDRHHWEKVASPESLTVVDSLLSIIREFEPKAEPNFTSQYIGIAVQGKANNVVLFNPGKSFCRLFFRLPQTPETDKEIEDSGLELVGYEASSHAYKIRLSSSELATHKTLVGKWLRAAYDFYA